MDYETVTQASYVCIERHENMANTTRIPCQSRLTVQTNKHRVQPYTLGLGRMLFYYLKLRLKKALNDLKLRCV